MEDVFKAYTKGDSGMDGRTFVKFLKDNKIIDKVFTTTDADLLFTKLKAKGARKIELKEFRSCIEAIALKKKVSVEDIETQLATSSGPVFTGTKALPTKFHDDKTMYTGVHARGGPSTVDTGRTGFGDLSEMTDRSAANIRGVNVKVADGAVAAPRRSQS